MLSIAARFHTYSLNNVLLILSACPDATQVAGCRSGGRLAVRSQTCSCCRRLTPTGTIEAMNEPVCESDDLDVAAAVFWADTDIDALLEMAKPCEGADEFAIADLTDEDWEGFVAAIDA